MLKTKDYDGRVVALFNSTHELNFYSEKYPEIAFSNIS